MPGINRQYSCFSQFVALLLKLFPAFVEAGEVPQDQNMAKLEFKLKEQSFWLRLVTCCARIAGLLASLASICLTDGRYQHV